MTTNAATGQGLQVVHGARDEPGEALGLLANARRVADETIANARADADRVLATARHNAAMLEQQALRHIEELHPRVVRAAHHAAGEKFAGPTRLGNRIREQPAGRGLGDRETFLLRAQQIAHDLRERIVAVAR